MKTRTLVLTVFFVLLMATCSVHAARIGTESRSLTEGGFTAPEITTATIPGLITNNMTVAGVNKNSLAARIVGSGVSYSNVTFRGVNWSAGFFSNGTGIIGISKGIILSSGDIGIVKGPNTVNNTARKNNLAGDADLDTLFPFPYNTYDATVLEFDFVPTTNVIKIQYVFSSDEYNEFANSNFNDVFGFFVNGKNIAKLPDTANVTINNINLNHHPEYFRNNERVYFLPGPCPINTEMDGLTTVITSMVSVTPGKLNHMKIAIADAGDYYYDSNVFITATSISTYTGPVVYTVLPAAANIGAVEKLIRVSGDNFNKSANFSLTRGAKILKITNKTYLSRTRMDFNVTVPWSSPAGSWNLTVKNPDGKVYKATNIFTVKNPVPAITTFTPTSITHGSPGFTLNITGSNFVPTSRIYFRGVAKPTVWISPKKVSATITSNDILTPGSAVLKVNNSAPGGGWSNIRTFTLL